MQAVQPSRTRCELSDVAKRPVPVLAAPELQMPIQIEELPAREAPEPLWLAVQMTLHVFDRRARVQHRELFPQRLHRLKRGVQLLGCEVDERRLGAGEIGGRERSQRVGKCDRTKAEIP